MYFHPNNIILAIVLALGVAIVWNKHFSQANRKPHLINYGLLALLVGILIPSFVMVGYRIPAVIAAGAALIIWLRSTKRFPKVDPATVSTVIAAGVAVGFGVRYYAGQLFDEGALVAGIVGVVVLVLLYNDTLRNVEVPDIRLPK